MRQHLRTDSTKMFDEDEKNLQIVMRENNIKNRSDGHRHSMKVCATLGQIPIEQRNLANQVEALTQQVQQLYFILQEKMK